MLAMPRRPFFWIITLAVVAFALAPVYGNDVSLRESLLLDALYITLASNLNLMLGYAGYVNFGSIVFFGLGGYICVWLVNSYKWTLAPSLVVAGVCVSGLALIFGFGIPKGCVALSSRCPPLGSSRRCRPSPRTLRRGADRPAFICRPRSSRRSAVRRTRSGSYILSWSA